MDVYKFKCQNVSRVHIFMSGIGLNRFSFHINVEKEAGIYILCSGNKIRKLNDDDSCGVLYIGKSKNLKRRLKLNIGGEFDHSSLSYVVSFQVGVLKFFRYNANGKKLPIKKGILNDAKPKLLYFYCDNIEEEECSLLIGHIMKYGQAPALNSSSTKWAYNKRMESKKDKWYWSTSSLKKYEYLEGKLKNI